MIPIRAKYPCHAIPCVYTEIMRNNHDPTWELQYSKRMHLNILDEQRTFRKTYVIIESDKGRDATGKQTHTITHVRDYTIVPPAISNTHCFPKTPHMSLS